MDALATSVPVHTKYIALLISQAHFRVFHVLAPYNMHNWLFFDGYVWASIAQLVPISE